MSVTRPKRLPKTLRERSRYVAFKIYSGKRLGKLEVRNAIRKGMLGFLGVLGASEAKAWLVDFNEESQKGFVKCTHTQAVNTKAALITITSINNTPIIFHVLGVSGTIRKTKKKYLG